MAQAISTRQPTKQQSKLIKMASAGTTRAKVRRVLGYDEGARIGVQTMLKKLERFGYKLRSEIGDDRTATYFLDAKKAAPRRKRATSKR
jgi:hypothetical protein